MKEKETLDVYDSLSLEFLGKELLPWFRKNQRVLPWRKESEGKTEDGYRVWVSEIMLQQTRVEAVKEYYLRFLKELPDVCSLAMVPEERLLKLWEGLGYYNRVKNLKKAAAVIEEEYHGEFPKDYASLLKLPGIGNYTAGAVASIAFQQPVPAVDGNVLRVMMRLLGCRDDISQERTKKKLERTLLPVIPKEAPGEFNQALMELGATVCIPNGAPHCEVCPLSSKCVSKKEDITNEIPHKAPRRVRKIEEKTIFLFLHENKVAVRKRPKNGLLAGLWEFPMEEGKQSVSKVSDYMGKKGISFEGILLLGTARHIFSHIEWHMTGYAIPIKTCREEWKEQFEWVDIPELQEKYALPSAFSFYQKRLLELL